MNTTELIDQAAEKSDLSKADTKRAYDAIVESVKEAIASGSRVSLTNFLTLESKFRPAKKGRNPQDGSEIQIPARYQVKIRPGKALKEAANKNK